MSERAAESLALTGWVKNLNDSRVEVLCEGSQDSLNEFLRKINDIFKEYITDYDIKWSEATGEFDGFGVRY